MGEITLDVYLNGEKIGFVKSQDWYNSGRMFFVDERQENPVCKGYFPEEIENYGGFDKVSFKVREQPKRKPLPDGTLELTESELIEFFSLTGRTNDGKYPIYFFKNVYIEDCYYIYADMSRRGENYEKDSGHILITNIKAILWLADRFELTSNN